MTYQTLTSLAQPDQSNLATDSKRHRALQQVAHCVVPAVAAPSPIAILAAAPKRLPARQPLPTPVFYPDKPILKVGLDVHLELIMAVIQRGHSALSAPRKLDADQLIAQVQKWVKEGAAVYCVSESAGFGFVLHRRLVAAGAQSFVIAPIVLGPRKTDKLDARALCTRLSRWLEGEADELSPIRIATLAEQQRREATRRRKFLCREVRRLANRGHGVVAEFYHQKLPHRWWGPLNWKKLGPTLDPWVLELLGQLRQIILLVETQLAELEKQVVARLQGPRPKGLGELTLATLDAEMCDWGRFHNRKQVGSYTGCCPGEHSSGNQRRIGSIDRLGNGRVRTLLVETVWRMLHWQPNWKAALKMRLKLGAGTAMKKKTVIALVRQLAVDLWRWRTGRNTLEELGWVAA